MSTCNALESPARHSFSDHLEHDGNASHKKRRFAQ